MWARLSGAHVGTGCRISSHDIVTGETRPVTIGRWCFVGGGSMTLRGVTIGDECVIGSGAVVFEDMPARGIVVGNPAQISRQDVPVGPLGRLKMQPRGEA